MGKAKNLVVSVIDSKTANTFMRKHHYSGKVVNNSVLHFGVYLNNRLHGVMQYGSPLDKSKVLPLVIHKETKNTVPWNDMLELNRMAFDDTLPKNSESRAIAISILLIKRNAPNIKWILSFSDGTQCGDGTIYRASGFELTLIKKNHNTCRLPDGSVIHKMTLESSPTRPRPELEGKSYYDLTNGKYDFNKYLSETGAEVLIGFQLRYVKIIDDNYQLSCEKIPFAKINEVGAGMYKGKKIERQD